MRSWDEDEEYGLHDIDVLALGGTVDDLPGGGGDGRGGERGGDSGNSGAPQGDAAQNPYLAEVNQRWGPDHPHVFAKGCEDGVVPTPLTGRAGESEGQWATAESEAAKGGKPAAQAATGSHAEEPAFVASGWAGPAFGTIPFTRAKGVAAPGASPLAEPVVAAVVAAADDDDAAGVYFEAALVFAGARDGLGFRVGSQGLGYYRLSTQHS